MNACCQTSSPRIQRFHQQKHFSAFRSKIQQIYLAYCLYVSSYTVSRKYYVPHTLSSPPYLFPFLMLKHLPQHLQLLNPIHHSVAIHTFNDYYFLLLQVQFLVNPWKTISLSYAFFIIYSTLCLAVQLIIYTFAIVIDYKFPVGQLFFPVHLSCLTKILREGDPQRRKCASFIHIP